MASRLTLIVNNEYVEPHPNYRLRMRATCKCGLTFIGRGYVENHVEHTWLCETSDELRQMMERYNHAARTQTDG